MEEDSVNMCMGSQYLSHIHRYTVFHLAFAWQWRRTLGPGDTLSVAPQVTPEGVWCVCVLG